MEISTESLTTTKITVNQPCIKPSHHYASCLANKDPQGFQQIILRKGVRMTVPKMYSGSSKRSIRLQTNFKEWR
jgi:hypothetical protein